jgi:hypothetical protein
MMCGGVGLRRGGRSLAVIEVRGNDRTYGADGTNGLVGRVPNWGSALPGGLWGRAFSERGGAREAAGGMGDRCVNGERWASRLTVLLVRQSSLAGADG